LGQPVDLHVHTTASDGTLSPREVVRRARHLGMVAVGVCDHDTTEGLDEALAAAEEEGVELVPGVEINCHSDDDAEVHILGYYVDWHQPELCRILANLRRSRRERMACMVSRLAALGVEVSLDEVLAEAGPAAPGRLHLARVMVNRGYVDTVPEAFDRYLHDGGPAYVPRLRMSPVSAVALIRRAGGVPVLAHPGLGGVERLLNQLLQEGLLGLEVVHPHHRPEDVVRYRALAAQYGLIPTGGSDCHGPSAGACALLGRYCVDYQVVARLKEARDALRATLEA